MRLVIVFVPVAQLKGAFQIKLKLLKNMPQERLNSLFNLCIKKKLLDKIDIDAIINDFTSKTC